MLTSHQLLNQGCLLVCLHASVCAWMQANEVTVVIRSYHVFVRHVGACATGHYVTGRRRHSPLFAVGLLTNITALILLASI